MYSNRIPSGPTEQPAPFYGSNILRTNNGGDLSSETFGEIPDPSTLTLKSQTCAKAASVVQGWKNPIE